MTSRARPRRPTAFGVFGIAFLTLWVLLEILPLLWVLRTSLAPRDTLFSSPFAAAQGAWTLDNYARVLGVGPDSDSELQFLAYLSNSVVYTTIVVTGQVTFSTMAGYAFARLTFPGREFLFGIFLSGLMVPPIFTALPNFVLMKNLDLLDTFAALAAPTFFVTPFAVFFMRQFFLGVPRELEEAAMLDGCNRWQIFTRVVAPCVSGPIITLAIVTAVTTWNDYLWPLLVGTETTKVLNVGLSSFLAQSRSQQPDWAGLMAGSVLSVLPVLVILSVFGRRLVASLNFTGVK
ncbi:carbohydrate ABC transporter membrane protein 2, CUT1 family [Austwickia chelonae]|uniref:Putative ABC transporter permease protein n=1 Tax=Austwickia chelonae NBRC 105200 TaxID=1184607 RepID=K6UNC8_9MICO|nr:carbohydrate ABC transporter permease [Austwickia chelonae]GAB78871.1 putative ABC transporter permease protein [Austwickia chelonae NBRC 105200]SEV85652.1 carbohydrate ABC transporter membrane protein 2, CUT1 family [Austwickia chelonae]